MMYLTVEEYNARELEGKKFLSNRFLEAFQPELFNHAGFPARVQEEEELIRYVDSMHDGRVKEYYECMAPTETEFETIQNVAKDIYDFSARHYGRGIVVKAPLLSSMHTVRTLKHAVTVMSGSNEENIKIFEIGGGSGTLGVMLNREGYGYASTDITQAFYLMQNRLMENVCEGNAEECLDSVLTLHERQTPNSMLHIPWWKVWELRDSDLEADIMVANHNLLEMHQRSLRFYLQYGKRLMRNSRFRLLVAQSLGSGLLRGEEYLMSLLSGYDYHLVYTNGIDYVFRWQEQEARREPLNEKRSLGRRIWRRIVKQNERKKALYEKENEKFTVLDEESKRDKKVPFQEIQEWFLSLGGGQCDSPDEEFIHYLGLNRL